MPVVSVYSAQRQSVSIVSLAALKDLSDVTLVASVDATPRQLSRVLPLDVALKSYPFDDTRDRPCTIGYHRNGIFFHEPHRGSRGSAATYWLVHAQEGMLLLVQHLRAGARTSTHWHACEIEHFYPLFGASLIHIGSLTHTDPCKARREFSLRLALETSPHVGIRIEPPHVHSLETADDSPALNLLVVYQTHARSLSEINHNHVEWIPDE